MYSLQESAGIIEPDREWKWNWYVMVGSPKGASKANSSSKNQQIVKTFAWEIASISVYFQEIRYSWAKILGISGPQWLILTALRDLDTGQGASVKSVAKMLHVDASFVTTQSKILEKKGFVRRRTSDDDARVVEMSLTDKSYKHMANLASREENLNEFIFEEFTNDELRTITDRLALLKNRLEKASLRMTLDI